MQKFFPYLMSHGRESYEQLHRYWLKLRTPIDNQWRKETVEWIQENL